MSKLILSSEVLPWRGGRSDLVSALLTHRPALYGLVVPDFAKKDDVAFSNMHSWAIHDL